MRNCAFILLVCKKCLIFVNVCFWCGILKNKINCLLVQDNISNEEIKNLIYTIRGKQVMLDIDVVRLYHYDTRIINETVSRNKRRFPIDFCFQLTEE